MKHSGILCFADAWVANTDWQTLVKGQEIVNDEQLATTRVATKLHGHTLVVFVSSARRMIS